MLSSRKAAAVATCFLTAAVTGLQIPGLAPTEYRVGDPVPIFVNALTPTQSREDQSIANVVSYDYYLPRFHHCIPASGVAAQAESLGSTLLGDRIYNSAIDIKFLQEEQCKHLCTTSVPPEDAGFINQRIREGYVVQWLIDGLPAASVMYDSASGQVFDAPGFALGKGWRQTSEGTFEPIAYYNNAVEILIEYHKLDDEDHRIVGVSVRGGSHKKDCGDEAPLELSETPGATNHIPFYYSVTWQESQQTWATRWDRYVYSFGAKLHWFSLIESFAVVVFLSGMVAMVLIRTLKKDIQRYNALDLEQEDVNEDSGWKLIHGDVFRPPSKPMLLSVMLGNGVQLFLMVGTTILFALLGFLRVQNRGSIATAALVFFALYGFVGGFASALLYKTLGQAERFKTLLFLTPTFVPGIVFAILVFLNFFLIHQGSSGAVPLGTLFALVALWFLVTLPLSILGGWLGFKRSLPADPVRTNQIPRQIPDQSFYLKALPSILLSGALPFGAIFVELYFIMSSVWLSYIYQLGAFLFLAYGILIVTSGLVTILMTYFQLCSENYHWWWRSFFTGAAIAPYVFLNAVFYYVTKFRGTNLTTKVLYFGYSGLLAFLVGILGGTIGFFASYWFVRKAYGSIKVD